MRVEMEIPDEVVEAVAARAAEIVLERLGDRAVGERASDFVTVEEAAEILRSARQRVYDLLSAGRLTRLKDGSRVLIRRDEIDAHLAGRPVAHALPTGRRSRMGRGIAA